MIAMPEDAEWHDSLAQGGFALIGGRRETEILDFARALGTPAAEPRDGVVVKPLRPVVNAAAPENTLSSRYGEGSFPLHTEGAYWRVPPRFLLLFCVDPGECEQVTLLLDGDPLRRDQENCSLATSPWLVSAGLRSFLSTVVGSDLRVRFDRDCMRPTTALGLLAESKIRGFISSMEPYRHRWRTGDLLIIDNWRTLHGRGGSRQGADTRRLLLKVMVSEVGT